MTMRGSNYKSKACFTSLAMNVWPWVYSENILNIKLQPILFNNYKNGHFLKLSLVAYAFNSSTWDAEAGRGL